ncbi:MAG: peptidoglycan -binding protein [Hyphomicrobiales bacterium]|uniref:peptidoglycan -binding protein n=1 Tax=Rhabdaerophilum calidifontis TaxID=2604328 RepID=UPI00123A322B|nr:peptidoglycan -binding protein [Rhabdaerophilum calidifontis]MCA1952143.1 peptidoglycan -binding protein [Hyphomicrobiales bacterium]MCA2000168.1 peptidoglycan -binding protein [Hyphomicrobiales bacterium]
MALGRTRGRERGIDYWPGFVDALSTLLLVFIFLLAVFMLGQFFISREIAGKDDFLQRLNQRIAELTDLLALEKTSKEEGERRLTALVATLEAERAERERLAGIAAGIGREQDRASELVRAVENERNIAARALREVELLNQQVAAMRQQLQALENALATAETREKDAQVRIADLGSRLNVALAQRVQELSRYRSDFFGRLRTVLGNRPDVRIVGDRFVFQSEIFFGSGADELENAGKEELDKLAGALSELERTIPPDIAWVARIDGHTDKRPLSGLGRFKDNWELSSARAIAVVRYLASKGVSPQRLVAAGFGEFAPIDFGDSPEALARNRRLELKLTER